MSQSKNIPRLIFVLGPTASGKSAFALRMAKAHRGTIINADALQIYEGLPILSAQPSLEEQSQIPHKLYGVIPPTERSSAGRWVSLAAAAIKDTFEEGRTPILVGGTGLYMRALTEGLAEIPPIPEAVRAEVQKRYHELGEESFRAELAKLDPISAARLSRNDRQRLMRAYEVARHTGRALSTWQKDSAKGKSDVLASLAQSGRLQTEAHRLLPERSALYAACDARFLIMMQRGATEEVQAFLQRQIDPTLPAAKTIGVRELRDFLSGEISREDAVARAQKATRNYAKRQMTWVRNQCLSIEAHT